MRQPPVYMFFVFSVSLLFSLAISSTGQVLPGEMKVWEETISLPTYFTDLPEECPVFFRQKSYQGASRVSYPYPEQDRLTMERGTREYTGHRAPGWQGVLLAGRYKHHS